MASRILVAEDSSAFATTIERLLRREGHEVTLVSNGREALERLESGHAADVLLADLIMPEVNGLKLTEEVRARHPRVPVVLMTSHGSEEIATAAMQRGAVGYISKRRLESDLVRTLQQVLGLSRSDFRHKQLLDSLDETVARFTLDGNPALFPHIVHHIVEQLDLFGFGDDGLRVRIGVALTECLDNAHFHGNLELSSELREGDGEAWSRESRTRRVSDPYRGRKIRVGVRISRLEAEFVISDDGPGFEVAKVADPTSVDNLERVSGRGIHLVRAFMDEVTFNAKGNEVRLVKRRPAPSLGE
jgi:CheY-like chemotaxis protein